MKTISRFRGYKIAAVVAVMSVVATALAVSPGFVTVDTTFGPSGTGYVVTDLGGTNDFSRGVTLGLNDELYQLGVKCSVANCKDGSTTASRTNVLVRYSKDGIVDSSFGNAGQLSLTDASVFFADGSNAADAMDVDDSNGYAYLAGQNCSISGCAVQVARFLFNGTLDTSYGTNGLSAVAYTSTNQNTSDLAIQVLSDGRVLVSGVDLSFDNSGNALAGGKQFLAVLKADGTGLDTSFNGSGVLTFSFGACDSDNGNRGVFVSTSTGNIYVTGSTSPTACSDTLTAAVARVTPAGALDSTFGSGGKVVSNFGQSGDNAALGAVENTAGEIGYFFGAGNGSSATVHVIELKANGTRDTGFTEQDGSFTSSFSDISNVAFQTNGEPVLGGTYPSSASNSDIAALRLDGNSIFAHAARGYPSGGSSSGGSTSSSGGSTSGGSTSSSSGGSTSGGSSGGSTSSSSGGGAFGAGMLVVMALLALGRRRLRA